MATISNTPRPGYVWDATDNCWYPIGTGPHSHADYITSSSAINPNIVDAKGDIIAATAADTVARLAVGTNGQVLKANSSTSTGLEWGSVSTTKSFSLISTTSLSGATSITISGLSGYDIFHIIGIDLGSVNGGSYISFTLNSDTGSNYRAAGAYETYASNIGPVAGDFTALDFGRTRTDVTTGDVDGTITIYGANTSGVKVINVISGVTGQDSTMYSYGAVYSGTSVISSITFTSSSGNFDEGTVYIYGAQ